MDGCFSKIRSNFTSMIGPFPLLTWIMHVSCLLWWKHKWLSLHCRTQNKSNRIWYINVPIEDVKSHWKLWVYAKQPLFRLPWDPTDYSWANPFLGNEFNFFQYFVQLVSRYTLFNLGDVSRTTSQYWSQHCLTSKFLSKFWGKLWDRKQPHQNISCTVVCLCIKPCMLVHGYTKWVHPLIVGGAICKKNHRNTIHVIALSLNWYGYYF